MADERIYCFAAGRTFVAKRTGETWEAGEVVGSRVEWRWLQVLGARGPAAMWSSILGLLGRDVGQAFEELREG